MSGLVHNHGIDPSCRESVVDGYLQGECMTGNKEEESPVDNERELRPYTFRVVFEAYSLDDALQFLEDTGFDTSDLDKVAWLD